MARQNHHKLFRYLSRPALAAVLFFTPYAAVGNSPTIRLTEIGSNPTGKSTECPGDACEEFVELFNVGPGSFSLRDSLFLTNGSKKNPIHRWEHSLTQHDNCRLHADSLLPGEFAVVLSKEYRNLPADHRGAFPDSTLLLKCDGPLLSHGLTDGRGVVLIRNRADGLKVDSICGALDPGQTLDSEGLLDLTYPEGLAEGFSLVPEYCLLSVDEYLINPDTISPGSGYISDEGWIAEYRLGLAGASHIPCTIAVWCPPHWGAELLEWRFEAGNVEVNSGKINVLQPFTVFTLSVPKRESTFSLKYAAGQHAGEMEIDISQRWLPENPLRISEIHPRTRSGMPEWFEITNVSRIPINIRDWKWGKSQSVKVLLTSVDNILEPGNYLVVTKSIVEMNRVEIRMIEPPHWQTLNDFRDSLFLEPPRATSPLETVFYDADWMGNWDQQSIERVHLHKPAENYDNWVCADHSTPGMPNAGAYRRRNETPQLHIGPVPFSPNEDGRDDFLRISASLPPGTEATIKILGFNGRVTRRLPIPSDGTCLWDGKDESGMPAQVGPFFIVAEFESPSGSERIRKRGILWR